MKTEDWKIIEAIYKTKNLTQASNQLFISQPALSKRLKNIEREVNCQIVIRHNKGIDFTPAGEYLAKQANAILSLTQQTLQHVQKIKRKTTDVLTLGAPSTFAKYFLVDILQAFKKQYPYIETQIKVEVSSDIPDCIKSGNVQCGFMFGNNKHPFKSHLIDIQECYAISSKPMSYEQMPQVPLIWHNRSQETCSAIFHWWSDHFDTPFPIRMKVTNLDTALDFVENNFGYTIAFNSFLHKRKNFHLLPLYNLDGSPFTRNSWFLYPDSANDNPNLRKFIDFTLELDKEHIVPQKVL